MSELVEVSKVRHDLECPDIPQIEKSQSTTPLPYPMR